VTGLYLDARGREKHVINQLDRRSLRSVKIGQQLNATANVIDGSADGTSPLLVLQRQSAFHTRANETLPVVAMRDN